MHYSLGITGLGHTLVGHVGRYMDLVECVLVPVAACQGVPWPASLSLRGPFPQALTLLEGARFIAWYLRCSLFKGMQTGPEAFLEPPGVSRLQPCTQTHQKKGLVLYSFSWWDIRQKTTFSQQSNLTVWTDTSICCTKTLILYICSVYSIHSFNLLSLLLCLLSGP